jgi:hypothetical protein
LEREEQRATAKDDPILTFPLKKGKGVGLGEATAKSNSKKQQQKMTPS